MECSGTRVGFGRRVLRSGRCDMVGGEDNNVGWVDTVAVLFALFVDNICLAKMHYGQVEVYAVVDGEVVTGGRAVEEMFKSLADRTGKIVEALSGVKVSIKVVMPEKPIYVENDVLNVYHLCAFCPFFRGALYYTLISSKLGECSSEKCALSWSGCDTCIMFNSASLEEAVSKIAPHLCEKHRLRIHLVSGCSATII